MSRIDGIVYFPYGMWFKKHTLGKNFIIKISEYEGNLSLPQYPTSDKFKYQEVLRMKLKPPKCINNNLDYKEVNWGQPVTYPTGDSQVNAAAIAFDFNNDEKSRECGKILNELLTDWFHSFRGFVEIITGQYIGRGPIIFSEKLEADLWYYEGNNSKQYIYKSIAHINIPIGDQIINTKNFKKILYCCSNSLKPNTIHLLLRDSIYAFNNGDFRKSLLDATTAIELILSSQLRASLLKKNNSDFVDLILKFETLGNLIDLAEKLKCKLPPGNLKEIVKPRNDAIHRSIIPTKNITNRIIHNCQELIHIYSIPFWEK